MSVYLDRRDPPTRKRCATCGKPRKPKPSRYSGEQAAADAFCSTACCKAYYGVEFPAGQEAKK